MAVRVPWRLLAISALLFEALLLQAATRAWVPWWLMSCVAVALIAVVVVVANARFRLLRKHHKPLDPQVAVQVGWCFVALRAVLQFGCWYCFPDGVPGGSLFGSR